VFEHILLGRSREQYDALGPAEQDEVDTIIHELERDPWRDGRRKVELVMAPVVISLWDDGRWRISYRVVDNRFVEIYAIRRIP
jgi:hypothetical protein